MNSITTIKISVITINLNNAGGLAITIRSIIEQTFKNFEFLIIDGGSIDESVDVIRKYENRISYWIAEEDGGIYNAMNKGINHANGEYCFFLNSGDYLADKFVFENIFKTNPTESILLGNSLMIKGEIVRIDKYPNIPFGLLYRGSICHQAAFISRSLFKKYGVYDDSLKIVADWKFFLQTIALHNESVKYLDYNIAYHDLFGVSITQEELFFQERKKVLKESVPVNILTDYDNYWDDIIKSQRLNSYKIPRFLTWLCEKFIIKLEKRKLKNEIEKITPSFESRTAELRANHES